MPSGTLRKSLVSFTHNDAVPHTSFERLAHGAENLCSVLQKFFCNSIHLITDMLLEHIINPWGG